MQTEWSGGDNQELIAIGNQLNGKNKTNLLSRLNCFFRLFCVSIYISSITICSPLAFIKTVEWNRRKKRSKKKMNMKHTRFNNCISPNYINASRVRQCIDPLAAFYEHATMSSMNAGWEVVGTDSQSIYYSFI